MCGVPATEGSIGETPTLAEVVEGTGVNGVTGVVVAIALAALLDASAPNSPKELTGLELTMGAFCGNGPAIGYLEYGGSCSMCPSGPITSSSSPSGPVVLRN